VDGVIGMSHTGFDVENLDRTVDFYTKVLDAKVQWRRDTERLSIMKLYVGNVGLSIPQRKAGAPKPEIPFPIHFAFSVDPDKADDVIAHIKDCDVDVDGPNGHADEPQNISWFFRDPDGYRLEIEAHYRTAEDALAVLERDKDQRRPDLALYQGTDATADIKAQLARATQEQRS